MFYALQAVAAAASLYTTEFYQNILNWDAGILLWVQENLRNDVLTPIMKVITHSVDGGIFWILLTVLLLIIPKTRKMGLCSMIALACSLLVCNLALKNIFERIRPYEVIAGLELIVEKADDPSFPSGHTCASFASSVALLFAAEKKQRIFAIVAVIYAFLVGFTRIYVGIHYPTDVIAAAFVATAFAIPAAIFGKKLYDFLAAKYMKKKADKKKTEA
ncbi:MAG: phosphatase PAP2 family protein [Lachnospiraceae bacterium]|nr:phosphatase PAP2 family protein [Lachnospiraceae bacterium]